MHGKQYRYAASSNIAFTMSKSTQVTGKTQHAQPFPYQGRITGLFDFPNISGEMGLAFTVSKSTQVTGKTDLPQPFPYQGHITCFFDFPNISGGMGLLASYN